MAETPHSRKEQLRNWFFGVTGHLVILFQSTPLVWAGMMTFPLFGLLIVLFGGSISGGTPEWILPLISSPNIVTFIFDTGLIIWIYSVFFLFFKKKKGLVISGIYRYIRHPQYLGVIMFTSTLTALSWWILANTFGISYISKEETILLWFVMVFGYIGLAFAEEYYLIKEKGEEYTLYQTQTALIIPFIKTRSKVIDIVVVLLFSSLLLYIQIMIISPAILSYI